MALSYCWCLPRPRRSNKYPGGFPEHFERRLLELLRLNPYDHNILQPFGGMAEYGIKLDIKQEPAPDIIGDAHYLPFRDNGFDLVILDPPYSKRDAQVLYSTPYPNWRRYYQEALRVTRAGGYIVVYQERTPYHVPGTELVYRILVELRTNHTARIAHVYKKGIARGPAKLVNQYRLGGFYE